MTQNLDHFFRVAFSIDLVLLTFKLGRIHVLIQEKMDYPVQGELGLPGRLMLPNESADKAILELVSKHTGQQDAYFKQLHTFSAIDRHPLGRIITFSYYSLISEDRLHSAEKQGGNWCPIDDLPELCLDHKQIIDKVVGRFKKGLIRHPIAFQLLPQEFTLSDVIGVYEHAFGIALDHSNFGKKLLNSGLLKPLKKQRINPVVGGRPARLFSFVPPIRSDFKDRIHFQFD